MTREQIVEVLVRWQQAMDQRNLDAYEELYAEAVAVESPIGGIVGGREGVRKVLEAFVAAFPDVTMTHETPLIDGSRLALVSTLAGTHTGHFMGLAPSGKPFRFTIVFLIEMRDGLIVRERRVYDFAGLLVQIGALKAKPA